MYIFSELKIQSHQTSLYPIQKIFLCFFQSKIMTECSRKFTESHGGSWIGLYFSVTLQKFSDISGWVLFRTPAVDPYNKFSFSCSHIYCSPLFLTGLSTWRQLYSLKVTRWFVSSWFHSKPTRHLQEIKELIVITSTFIIMCFVDTDSASVVLMLGTDKNLHGLVSP